MNDQLRDVYRGAVAFLLCPGPSLAATAENFNWHMRGLLLFAVNHAALVVRPHVFICADSPDRFHNRIWEDPGVRKLYPVEYAATRLRKQVGQTIVEHDIVASDCPNACGYYSRQGFDHSPDAVLSGEIMRCPIEGEACSLGIKGARSVMIPAMHLMIHMGIKVIYIVGADFRMDKRRPYAFKEPRTDGQVEDNRQLYEITRKRVIALAETALVMKGVDTVIVQDEPGPHPFERLPRVSTSTARRIAMGENIATPIKTDGWYYPMVRSPNPKTGAGTSDGGGRTGVSQ